MKQTIELNSRIIDYTLKVSARSRRMTLTVYPGGEFAVTVPRGVGLSALEGFIRRKAEWILKKIDRAKSRGVAKPRLSAKESKAEYAKHKDQALVISENKVHEFNAFYRFVFNRISIKNQKTRWGSCSKKGNLNFNYKIALLPERLVDYLVVHELCHLGQLNHSPKFWDLVAKTIPDYEERRRELRKVDFAS